MYGRIPVSNTATRIEFRSHYDSLNLEAVLK
jgi:hypothetical protein